MVVHFDKKEKEALQRALKSFDSELKTERLKSDDREFRECLREDQYLVERILRKVASAN